MPCQSAERDQLACSDDPPRTPTKSTGNDGAGADDQNGSTESENSSDDGLASAKQKNAKYVLMKRWVTGEEAEMEEEDIENEMFGLARDYMSASLLRKLPGHKSKETDYHLWKEFRRYTTKKGAQNRIFRCPMRHRCGCKAGIWISEGTGWKQLDRIGEHNADSHKQDKSKYLKHDQIVAVADAVTIAPQQSGAQLRRNMAMAGPSSPGKLIDSALLRSVQRRVQTSRTQLTQRKLEGLAIDTSYGSLTQLASAMWFRSLIDRHNDPDDEFHLNLFKPVIIGRDIKAENDILHLNISSPWFLFNALRAIATDRVGISIEWRCHIQLL